MHITKEHSLREVLIDEGGIGLRSFNQLVLVQRSGILCHRNSRKKTKRNSDANKFRELHIGFLIRDDRPLAIHSVAWIKVEYRICAIVVRIPYMNEAAQNYIRSTRLSDILDLQRIARGVNMEITQLDAGSFESDVAQLKVRNVLASRITSNQRLRLHGAVDFLTVSFLSHGSESLTWHGISASANEVLAANTGETFDLVVPPGVVAYCISVVANAEVTLRNLGGPVLAEKLRNTIQPIACEPDALRGIEAWLAEQFDGLGGNSEIRSGQALELEQAFIRRLAACIRVNRTSSSNENRSTSGRLDAARSVEQHLLDHPAIPQTIDDLCRVAGTSRRTLEYAFRDYFGTSPKRFTKVLRLNAARNDLLRGDIQSDKIVEIASGWGFTHMGQFSTDYRQMFAEKPSETLRRIPTRNGA